MSPQEQAGKDGASARSLGRDLLSNPFYAAKGMPSITGEKLEEWHAKAVAWEVGWRAEDSSRAGADTPQPLAGEGIAQQGLLMTLERARAIATNVAVHKCLKMRDGHAALDGSYSAEELEAIALVLRAGRDS
jgi:hypothetical protein